MIITREIINKNIKFYDVKVPGPDEDDLDPGCFEYTYSDLSIAIDLYKNLLIDNGVSPQETVTIGELPSIWQIAALFAAFELGLKVSISDYYKSPIVSRSKHKKFELDSKTKALLPIDYALRDKKQNSNKLLYNTRISSKEIVHKFSYQDLNSNSIELKKYPHNTEDDFIAVKSATSGTTGAPKCVEHSHRFLYELAHRNSKLFSGDYCCYRNHNFNHGSSLFCYIVPALISKDISNFYSFEGRDHVGFLQFISSLKRKTHLMFPYITQIEHFLNYLNDVDKKCPNIIAHVLTFIPKPWKNEFYSNKIIGDVISNFGSNETTGPVFLNKLSDDQFLECQYKLIDNFFKVKIVRTGLQVDMPVYNKSIIMNDRFESNGANSFVHTGRSNFIRINDTEVQIEKYQILIEETINGTLVYDQIRSKIYLAIWDVSYTTKDTNITSLINDANAKLKDLSLYKHYISKYTILNYEDYLGAIKLDMEKLREYFRNPDEDYQTID